eukprot:SAG11_NODE_6221_length_1360_cov_2.965900_1_plen_366_part_10
MCGSCLDGFFGEHGDSNTPCVEPVYGDGSTRGQATADCTGVSEGSSSGLYWLLGNDNVAYQQYCDMETLGGGWALASVISNTDGQDHFGENSWFSLTDCQLQGLGAPTPIWTSGVAFGDSPLMPDSTVNSKSAAYFSIEGSELLIHEVQGTQSGHRGYVLNTGVQTLEQLFASTETHDDFDNKATCSRLVGSDWMTSAFMQYETIDVNYLLANDGAVLASGAAQSEASSGLACRVDGHCGYGYDGNVCQGGARHYASDAIDAQHTVRLYVRPVGSTSCPANCADLHRQACDTSCVLTAHVCGACIDGTIGLVGADNTPCTVPSYGDGSSAEQAAADCTGVSEGSSSGLYWLLGNDNVAYQQYCDME